MFVSSDGILPSSAPVVVSPVVGVLTTAKKTEKSCRDGKSTVGHVQEAKVKIKIHIGTASVTLAVFTRK